MLIILVSVSKDTSIILPLLEVLRKLCMWWTLVSTLFNYFNTNRRLTMCQKLCRGRKMEIRGFWLITTLQSDVHNIYILFIYNINLYLYTNMKLVGEKEVHSVCDGGQMRNFSEWIGHRWHLRRLSWTRGTWLIRVARKGPLGRKLWDFRSHWCDSNGQGIDLGKGSCWTS